MTPEEKKTLQETIQLAGTDEPELLEESLISIFDSNSETFNYLESAQIELENNYEEKVLAEEPILTSLVKKIFPKSNTANAVNKGKVRIGTKFAGSVINVALSAAVGGLAGLGAKAVRAYILKKGRKQAAATIFACRHC